MTPCQRTVSLCIDQNLNCFWFREDNLCLSDPDIINSFSYYHPCRLAWGQSQQRLCTCNNCASKNCSDYEERAVFCITFSIWWTHWHTFKMKTKDHFTKPFQCSLHFYTLLYVQTDVWDFSSRFQLQVLAEVVRMFAGQVLHIFTPSWSFWGFAKKKKKFLFRNWNLLAWNQLDFIPELYHPPPLNYCWYGFLKAANGMSFLWLSSFLSKQPWQRSKWAHSVSS